MNRLSHLQYVVLLGFVLSIAAVLLAQRAPNKTLVVNGETTDATVMQIDGRSYVDIETLAQITNGTVTVEPNRIVLTIPVSNPAAAASASPGGIVQELCECGHRRAGGNERVEGSHRNHTHVRRAGSWDVASGLSQPGGGEPHASSGGCVDRLRPEMLSNCSGTNLRISRSGPAMWWRHAKP